MYFNIPFSKGERRGAAGVCFTHAATLENIRETAGADGVELEMKVGCAL